MITPALFLALALEASAAPFSKKLATRGEVTPQFKQATIVANVTDPAVSRDSCGSSRIGDRLFWTCRDTSRWDAVLNECTFPMAPTSASWTDLDSNGPVITTNGPVGVGSDGTNPIVQMYGTGADTLHPFLPIAPDMCPGVGMCDDKTRWVNWMDQPPAIAYAGDDGSFLGYTWSPKAHLTDLAPLNPEPPHTLYRLFYMANPLDKNTMPYVSVAADEFWGQGEISYGRYGQLVRDGTIYLYGKGGSGIALAKVDVHNVEDRSSYQYYVNGGWTSTMPSYNETGAFIDNAGAGGQGTFYYSSYYSSYIWIGQAAETASADFMLTTAPSPEGPWIEPYTIWSGQDGDSGLGGYTLQAHPGMLPSEDASENAIYLTYTQDWAGSTYAPGYVTPLIYLEFQ